MNIVIYLTMYQYTTVYFAFTAGASMLQYHYHMDYDHCIAVKLSCCASVLFV